ncbi:hypothetical protein EVAR_33074_1 [Eumeta japonica]|uniref:Uncharacterized protein n=1 Tax=Eumeta variegata TaxID=151549 RepID=A0A4C1WX12_EUMVA|nr:hypothetical protein EVAR_33074_1 [Eumeta japonica]
MAGAGRGRGARRLRVRRHPRSLLGRRGPRGEVTTARYVYSKPVIKNVSARVVCRPVIKVESSVVSRIVTGNASRRAARGCACACAAGPPAHALPPSAFCIHNAAI